MDRMMYHLHVWVLPYGCCPTRYPAFGRLNDFWRDITKVRILPILRHGKCVFSALYGGDITSRKCVFFKKVCILVT